MRIGGLQKTTTLDFPGKLSAVVFTQGCSFTCPYCHNPELIPFTKGVIEEAELLQFLKKRSSVLDGIVISGGEPTLQKDLLDFCATVKAMGYAIKIDTNGSSPKTLRALIDNKLVDYFAMDIKTAPSEYSPHICPTSVTQNVLESIAILNETSVPAEFRTTCVAPFVTSHNISKIVQCIAPHRSLYLQKANDIKLLNKSFFQKYCLSLQQEQILELQQIINYYIKNCHIR